MKEKHEDFTIHKTLLRHKKKHKPIIELLQTRIEKVPDKLVENTVVKTYCHDNDPSTEQKRKKSVISIINPNLQRIKGS